MTRQELIDRLTAWDPPEIFDRTTFWQSDALHFALWWYGASTEADKTNPAWPNDHYVKDKTGGRPIYLDEIEAALSLIPSGVWLNIKTGTQSNGPSWEWPVIEYGNQKTGMLHGIQKAKSLPVALCLVAIKTRVLRTQQEPTP